MSFHTVSSLSVGPWIGRALICVFFNVHLKRGSGLKEAVVTQHTQTHTHTHTHTHKCLVVAVDNCKCKVAGFREFLLMTWSRWSESPRLHQKDLLKFLLVSGLPGSRLVVVLCVKQLHIMPCRLDCRLLYIHLLIPLLLPTGIDSQAAAALALIARPNYEPHNLPQQGGGGGRKERGKFQCGDD